MDNLTCLERRSKMEIVNCYTLKDLRFKKEGTPFPEVERKKIIKAIENIRIKNYYKYSKKGAFEKALTNELPGYTDNKDECKVFKSIKSKIKNGTIRNSVDLYNPLLRIAIEVEKTKTTTLLLDVIKFIVGYKRRLGGKPIIEHGVLIIPDKYRTSNKPEGSGDEPFKRLCNDLALISPFLFVNDILIVVYDTGKLF